LKRDTLNPRDGATFGSVPSLKRKGMMHRTPKGRDSPGKEQFCGCILERDNALDRIGPTDIEGAYDSMRLSSEGPKY